MKLALSTIAASLAMFGLAGVADAAKVTSLVIRCVDRQEAGDDDVYLAAVRDGQPVPWGDDHQDGTSVGNSIDLNNDDADSKALTLDAKSLAELTFQKTLAISIMEKDVTENQTLGTVNITADAGKKSMIVKGGEGNDAFEYHIEYTVEK